MRQPKPSEEKTTLITLLTNTNANLKPLENGQK